MSKSTALFLTVPVLTLFLDGCLSLTVGTDKEPSRLSVDGLVDGYVSAPGIPDYDGDILHLGIFGSSQRPGEIASLDLWPIFGVGVGVVGARLRLGPVDLGLGALFYKPKTPHSRSRHDDAMDIEEESEVRSVEPEKVE